MFIGSRERHLLSHDTGGVRAGSVGQVTSTLLRWSNGYSSVIVEVRLAADHSLVCVTRMETEPVGRGDPSQRPTSRLWIDSPNGELCQAQNFREVVNVTQSEAGRVL
jgi:hypothetical protein